MRCVIRVWSSRARQNKVKGEGMGGLTNRASGE